MQALNISSKLYNICVIKTLFCLVLERNLALEGTVLDSGVRSDSNGSYAFDGNLKTIYRSLKIKNKWIKVTFNQRYWIIQVKVISEMVRSGELCSIQVFDFTKEYSFQYMLLTTELVTEHNFIVNFNGYGNSVSLKCDNEFLTRHLMAKEVVVYGREAE